MHSTQPMAIVADDDEDVRTILAWYLSKAGYDVLKAADGRDALKLLAAHPEVRLALIDLVMPNQEGIETIRAIRKQGGVRIIAMSGAFDGQFLATARCLGADATLLKPITPTLLHDTLADIMCPQANARA
jgi:two-component system response regulator VanR